ncbi:MAG TPA: nucleotidyltransferase domain-containing protein, partial [Ktedonobacterales bacterium]|nr:nucleotidyltransferase domain-containing protein [Ktedonobacterales bacterium]
TLGAEIDSDEVSALLLCGSYARGTATRYSDVDFARIVRTPPQGKEQRYFYRDGLLISVVTWSLEFIQESSAKPELAIWMIPCLREARILLDKEGAFSALQQGLAAFRWETLQEQANAWASDALMLFAVVVQKALGALLNQDETALAYATQELFYSLTWALAVQRGVLIEGGNSYYDQVQEAAGKDSAWIHAHRQILCLDPFPEQLLPVQARGIAALRLYQETAWLLRDAILPQDCEVIDQTLQIIEEASLAKGRQTISPLARLWL